MDCWLLKGCENLKSLNTCNILILCEVSKNLNWCRILKWYGIDKWCACRALIFIVFLPLKIFEFWFWRFFLSNFEFMWNFETVLNFAFVLCFCISHYIFNLLSLLFILLCSFGAVSVYWDIHIFGVSNASFEPRSP